MCGNVRCLSSGVKMCALRWLFACCSLKDGEGVGGVFGIKRSVKDDQCTGAWTKEANIILLKRGEGGGYFGFSSTHSPPPLGIPPFELCIHITIFPFNVTFYIHLLYVLLCAFQVRMIAFNWFHQFCTSLVNLQYKFQTFFPISTMKSDM